MIRRLGYFLMAAVAAGLAGCDQAKPQPKAPCIVNIVNFVRLLEPRAPADFDDQEALYQTTRSQIELVNRYGLPATFLLQYDALITPRYVQLMTEQLGEGSEVGGWWEITQPQVEAAGMTWRGRYPWDWHANVGFATGYTPQERERLVDVYMEKFKELFGRYPASVGSWFIDAHTLGYMADKYGITASCNCRDQVGTDGYTLWGGYWNQAYYPSRKNAYMPAQDTASQINVPVFRMLGSDPIAQYDLGDGVSAMQVRTLEPGCASGGGNPDWVRWFFSAMTQGPYLAFNYIQVGQENSFTWPGVQKGFEMQIPLVDSLRRAGALRVETLGTTGAWFKQNYPVTPTTAVTAMTSYQPEGARTVWFDSRFYRTNLYWEEGGKRFRIRDLHLFDENFVSKYLTEAGTSTECLYTTLPLVDGYGWSQHKTLMAGLRLMVQSPDGSTAEALGSEPSVSEPDLRTLQIEWPLKNARGTFRMTLQEERIRIEAPQELGWSLVFTAGPDAQLPFTELTPRRLSADLRGFTYHLDCFQGTFERTQGGLRGYRIVPENGKIVLNTRTGD